MFHNVRKAQYAPLPAPVRAAGAIIRKEYPPVLDPSQTRVGYGRTPVVPLDFVDKTYEDLWLDLKLVDIYRQCKASNLSYKQTVDTLVTTFIARFQRKGD